VKSLSNGRVACAALAAAVLGLGVASSAGASGTPWITRTTAKASASTSTSPASLAPGFFYVYDNLGPGNAYFCCAGWTVAGPSSSPGLAVSAMSFIPSRDAEVTQIDLALGNAGGFNGALIQLAGDNGGIPGTALGTWPVHGQPAFGGCCGLTTVHTRAIPVGAGRTYWVVAIAGNSDTWDAWNDNTTGATGGDFYDGTWYQYGDATGAFDVIGCGKICRVA